MLTMPRFRISIFPLVSAYDMQPDMVLSFLVAVLLVATYVRVAAPGAMLRTGNPFRPSFEASNEPFYSHREWYQIAASEYHIYIQSTQRPQ